MFSLQEGFMFNPESGCLYHPNGYDTSWLTYRDDKWIAEEWATYIEVEFAKSLLYQINEMYVESNCHA